LDAQFETGDVDEDVVGRTMDKAFTEDDPIAVEGEVIALFRDLGPWYEKGL